MRSSTTIFQSSTKNKPSLLIESLLKFERREIDRFLLFEMEMHVRWDKLKMTTALEQSIG